LAEKQHQCPVVTCGKRFREKGNMKNHYKLHVRITLTQLIKTNIFNPEEMKIEQSQHFSIDSNDLRKNVYAFNSEATNFTTQSAKVAFDSNLNSIIGQDYQFGLSFLSQLPYLSGLGSQVTSPSFVNYLQSSFNLNELYNIFKKSA
jgi:hypothetical protein